VLQARSASKDDDLARHVRACVGTGHARLLDYCTYFWSASAFREAATAMVVHPGRNHGDLALWA
jgi:hypothetical protein